MSAPNGKPDPRSRADLVRILDAAAAGKDLRWRGSSLLCPYHDDHSPSAGIYAGDDGHWRFRCLGCGATGDALDLLARARDMSLGDLFRSFSSSPAARPPARTATPASNPNPEPRGAGVGGAGSGGPAGQPIIYTLSSLRAKIKNFKTIRIYNTKAGVPFHGVIRCEDPSRKTGKRIIQCRWVSDGVVRGSDVRGGWELKAPEKPWLLYNLPSVTTSEEVWVVEGEGCANALIGGGVCGTTCAGGAGVLGSEGVYSPSGIHTDWSVLSGKRVYLWPDWDEVGEEHMRWVLGVLRELRPSCELYWIDPLSVGACFRKWDVCDYLGDSDPRSWPMLLSGVRSKAVRCGASMVRREMMQRVRSGTLRPVPLPFTCLDDLTRALSPGALTVLGATPGKGKSFFLMQCALHWHSLDVPFQIMQLEHPLWWHLCRLSAIINRDARLFDLKWLESSENWSTVDTLDAKDGPLFDAIGASMTIGYDKPDMDHKSLLSWIETQAKSGCRVICVDPVTALDAKGGRIWELDRSLVMGSKKIAVDHACSVLFVTHPRGGTKGKILGVDDISGGRSYGQFSQTVIWIEFLQKPKSFFVHGMCGGFNCECDAVFHISKVSQGKGAARGVGFNWYADELRWAEQGRID